MAPSQIITRTRLLLACCAGALLLVVAPGCAPEHLEDATSADCATPDGCAADADHDGEDPGAFCDDHDPCTTDANCTPCSTLPAEAQDAYHCTADQDLPPLCAGRTGCVHAPMTTPEGQIDSCFPVADAADAHAGSCRAGRCVENEEF